MSSNVHRRHIFMQFCNRKLLYVGADTIENGAILKTKLIRIRGCGSFKFMKGY